MLSTLHVLQASPFGAQSCQVSRRFTKLHRVFPLLMPPQLGERASAGGPPGRAGKVLGDVQPASLTIHRPGKHAVPCCGAGSSTSRSHAAPKGRVWLRQAGSGTREQQGLYPVSLHGLAGVCTAVPWDCTGLSHPVSLRLVPPLLPGELLRSVKTGFCPQHRFFLAMQINLLVTKKRGLTCPLHRLRMWELLGFLSPFSSCSRPRAASST